MTDEAPNFTADEFCTAAAILIERAPLTYLHDAEGAIIGAIFSTELLRTLGKEEAPFGDVLDVTAQEHIESGEDSKLYEEKP